jgi:hypothetical protein
VTTTARARSCPRRFLFVLAFVGAAFAAASDAESATARVRWLPRGAAATSYSVYVRNAGSTYGASPHWSGTPTAAADGTASANVTYTTAPSGTNYFTIVALSASGESALSNEIPIGPVDRCRSDSCVTKTSCDFGNRPNGTSCDDDVFCNGPEVCLNGVCDTSPTRDCADAIACTVDTCEESEGRCKNMGPPGCCVACDSADPCLADACAEGDCTAPAGTDIEFNRIRFMNKKSGIKLAAKGSFEADPTIDISTTRVVLEFRAIDGTVLYTSTLLPGIVRASAQDGRFRYTATRAQSDFYSMGMTRFDLRVKGTRWYVTAKAETSALMDAFLEPTISVMLRLGDEACMRRVAVPCSQSSTLSVCR